MAYPSNSGGIARDLKSIVTEARPLIEQQLELTVKVAGLRDAATAKGLDWSQIKALLKAQIEDENDESGEGKRVKRLVEKAEHATDYAALLGLASMNEKNSFGADESADQSTAARKDVPGIRPESKTHTLGQPTSELVAGTVSKASMIGEAGTQAPPVDTHLEIASPAQTGKPAPLAGVGGDEDRPPLSKQWGFKDKPHHDCLNPTQCGGFSNLGLCEPCKQAAA